MNTVVSKRPLIKQGWLRVLLFILVYWYATMIIYLPVGTLIKFLKKDNTIVGKALDVGKMMNGEFLWLTILVLLLISLVVVYIFRRLLDRQSFLSLGFTLEGHAADACGGFFLALAILGSGALILFFSGHVRWSDVTINGSQLFIEFGIFLMVAFSEEIVFRGYILNNLMESLNKWIALGLSALLFVAFHLDNQGFNLVPMVNIFLAGILLGINYIYTKNLWFAILFHLAWNFFQGPVLGFKVSGVIMDSILQSDAKGDIALTGGNFGFEGSIIDTGLSIVVILFLYLLYEKKIHTGREVLATGT